MVGRSVRLDGAPHQVVGVMPAGFHFPGSTDVWDRLAWNLSNHSRGAHFMESVARLRPGVTVEQVNRELSALTTRLARENGATNDGWGARVLTLDREVAGIFRPALFALFGAAGLLLVIACINVANLLLARATARQREVAIRAAIGASRGRLVRQLLTESLVLGALGGLAGLGIAVAGVRGLLAWSPIAIPRSGEVEIDAIVLLFTTALAAVTALAFGLAPALLVSRAELHDALKESAKSASAGVRGQRARNALVVAEVALAVMLLSGAGLLIRSVAGMLGEDTGVSATQSLTADIQLPATAYAGWDRVSEFYTTLGQRLRAHPQVAEAGASNFLPLEPGWRMPFQIVGHPETRDPPVMQNHTVDEGYFGALGVPVVRGRGFTDRDLATTTPVVMINEAAARAHFGGEDPVGRQMVVFVTNVGPLGRRVVTGNVHEVIGVVGDIRNASLKDVAEPAMFFTYRQFPFRKMFLVVRGRGSTADLLRVVRGELRAVDPSLPLANVRTMDRVLASSVDPPRFVMMLMTAFAALSLTLAAVGIYGILSYAVTAREKEIGIRLALGARPGQVLRMVLREGLSLVIAGCVLGVLGAWAGGRALGGLLYGVGSADPVTWLGVVAVVVGVAAAACLVPGRRAARVDAVGVLRGE
jgi:putative ABC transport system permease protein